MTLILLLNWIKDQTKVKLTEAKTLNISVFGYKPLHPSLQGIYFLEFMDIHTHKV